MWDDDAPPPRYRADQPGREYADDRRYHDWSDLEARPEPPQPVQEPRRAALRVLPDPTPIVDAAPEPTPPRRVDLVAGFRALMRSYAETLDEHKQLEERPPWER